MVAKRANDQAFAEMNILVIERKKEGFEKERESFWRRLFRSKNVIVQQFDSILEFDFGST